MNKQKIRRALKATQEFILKAEARGAKETFDMGNDVGFTVLWCEKRNANMYLQMLQCNSIKDMDSDLLELYHAI